MYLFFKKLILQKVFNTRLVGFFLKRNSKSVLIFNFLLSIFIFDIAKADTNFHNFKNKQIEIEYLESRNELNDYIIDTGDSIYLKFFPADQLNGIFPVNEEGELFLPRLNETFVRGLTISELENLLEKRYAEFIIEPDIEVSIAVFKNIRVLAKGELRNPGFYNFPAYKSSSFLNFNDEETTKSDSLQEFNKEQPKIDKNLIFKGKSSNDIVFNRFNQNISTISDVIRKAGGITASTDLSRIEIIRDVPIGKGGGKKRALVDLYSYINESDDINDIRIFDGDILFFPKLNKVNPDQISKSILSGMSPKFIAVNLYGRVQNPGIVRLPIEATLSDAIDLTGPIKPLSGKVILIRYDKDGRVLRKNIAYSARAKRGSKRNPYLKEDDLISVKNSFFGKSAGLIKAITDPFTGIYSTKKLIEDF